MADQQINDILQHCVKSPPPPPPPPHQNPRGERASTELYTHCEPRHQISTSTRWQQTAVLLDRKQKLQLEFSWALQQTMTHYRYSCQNITKRHCYYGLSYYSLCVYFTLFPFAIVHLLVLGRKIFRAEGYERVTRTAIAAADWPAKHNTYPPLAASPTE
jgi:hypothetical protein